MFRDAEKIVELQKRYKVPLLQLRRRYAVVERKSRSFRLSVATIAEIEAIAEREGMTATAVVSEAVHRMHDGADTEASARLADAKKEAERLAAALARAQETTKVAQETARAAQETAKAAQALHAQAEKRIADAEERVRALPGPDDWKDKSLLDRILKR